MDNIHKLRLRPKSGKRKEPSYRFQLKSQSMENYKVNQFNNNFKIYLVPNIHSNYKYLTRS